MLGRESAGTLFSSLSPSPMLRCPKPLRSGVEEDESERLQAPALGCELGVSGLFPQSWCRRTARSPTRWGGQTPVPLISPQPGFQLPLKVENTKG